MATTSPDNLRTPNPGDPYNLVADLATLASDTQVALNKKVSNLLTGTAAQRVAATGTATAGMLWQDTDGIKMIWRKDGAAWVPAVWRWSGTSSQRTGFTQAPDGFEWFNTSDNSDYVRLAGVWKKRLITSQVSYSGANKVGPVMFLTTGISGAAPGTMAQISWSPFSLAKSGTAGITISNLLYTTDGSTPINTSSVLHTSRNHVNASGIVTSAPGGSIQVQVAASGLLNVGLHIGGDTLYGPDPCYLNIVAQAL